MRASMSHVSVGLRKQQDGWFFFFSSLFFFCSYIAWESKGENVCLCGAWPHGLCLVEPMFQRFPKMAQYFSEGSHWCPGGSCRAPTSPWRVWRGTLLRWTFAFPRGPAPTSTVIPSKARLGLALPYISKRLYLVLWLYVFGVLFILHLGSGFHLFYSPILVSFYSVKHFVICFRKVLYKLR